jgi:hypothetical protein
MVECCRSRSLPRSLGGLSPLCGGAGAFPLQRSNLGQTTPCRGSFGHGVPGQLWARTPGDGDDSKAIQLAPASCASNFSPSTIGSSLGHWVNFHQKTRLVSNTIFRNFYRQWFFDLVNQATSPIQLLQKGNRVLSRCDRLGEIGSIEQLGGRRDHISDSPGIPFGGVELVSELDKIALSLLLRSSSRSSSFLICSILCSIAYCCTLISIVGCLLAAVGRRRRLPGGRHGRHW